MNIESYLQQVGSWLLSSGLQIALVLVLMAIAMRLSGLLVTRLVSFGEKIECRRCESQEGSST